AQEGACRCFGRCARVRLMEIAKPGCIGLCVVLALLVAGCTLEVPKADESFEATAGSGASAASNGDSDAGLNGGAPSGVNSAGSTSTAGRNAGEEASCDEECQEGDELCADGRLTRCDLVDGCSTWSSPTDCPLHECEDSTTCLECDDPCEVGEAACVEGAVRLCETGARGCNVWSAPTPCATGTCSSGTQCLRCVD